MVMTVLCIILYIQSHGQNSVGLGSRVRLETDGRTDATGCSMLSANGVGRMWTLLRQTTKTSRVGQLVDHQQAATSPLIGHHHQQQQQQQQPRSAAQSSSPRLQRSSPPPPAPSPADTRLAAESGFSASQLSPLEFHFPRPMDGADALANGFPAGTELTSSGGGRTMSRQVGAGRTAATAPAATPGRQGPPSLPHIGTRCLQLPVVVRASQQPCQRSHATNKSLQN